MRPILGELRDMSLPARYVTVGAAVCGAAGAIIGLVVGLIDNAQTAWFALAEAGIPASLLGGLIGLIVAVFMTASRRLRRAKTPSA
jgi:ethanolamine transporter EutH